VLFLSYSHLLLALGVVFVWGTNFVVIRWELDGSPPFLFATLRFAFSALPALLLIRRPAATITPLALLVPVFGMASSALSLGEPLPAWKLTAGALVLCGMAVIVLWPRWRAVLASDG
jgi:drug/metabolite transporter (DMT)-like permease